MTQHPAPHRDLAAALQKLRDVRRYEEIAAEHARLCRQVELVWAHLLGLIDYARPIRPGYLTFGCASGVALPSLVAGVDGRGVCIAPVDGSAAGGAA